MRRFKVVFVYLLLFLVCEGSVFANGNGGFFSGFKKTVGSVLKSTSSLLNDAKNNVAVGWVGASDLFKKNFHSLSSVTKKTFHTVSDTAKEKFNSMSIKNIAGDISNIVKGNFGILSNKISTTGFSQGSKDEDDGEITKTHNVDKYNTVEDQGLEGSNIDEYEENKEDVVIGKGNTVKMNKKEKAERKILKGKERGEVEVGEEGERVRVGEGERVEKRKIGTNNSVVVSVSDCELRIYESVGKYFGGIVYRALGFNGKKNVYVKNKKGEHVKLEEAGFDDILVESGKVILYELIKKGCCCKKTNEYVELARYYVFRGAKSCSSCSCKKNSVVNNDVKTGLIIGKLAEFFYDGDKEQAEKDVECHIF